MSEFIIAFLYIVIFALLMAILIAEAMSIVEVLIKYKKTFIISCICLIAIAIEAWLFILYLHL